MYSQQKKLYSEVWKQKSRTLLGTASTIDPFHSWICDLIGFGVFESDPWITFLSYLFYSLAKSLVF